MYNIQQRILAFLVCILISCSLFSQTIKIASIAPESSPWGLGLNKMTAEWSEITNGRVRLRPFHGGVAGTEISVIRKMRLGQIHAITASPIGLTTIVPSLWGLIIPGVIKTKDELDYLLEEMREDFDNAFREQGYEVLTWSNSGWIKFFSRYPILNPDDLKGQRIAATGFDEGITTILSNLGMQVISLGTTDVLSSLNSRLIDTVVYAPIGVAAFQWFSVTDNMLDLNIAPFFGAIILESRTWKKIPEQYHAELKASAQNIGSEITSELNKLENDALNLMQEFGLTIRYTSQSELDQWYNLFEESRKELNDKYLSSPLIQEAHSLLEKYRSQ